MNRYQYPHSDNVIHHRVIAEKAIGKPLPKGAVIHHMRSQLDINAHNNLVICENQAYHLFLEARLNAYRATGDPKQRPCGRCGKYDKVENMNQGADCRTMHNQPKYQHSECNKKYMREYRQRRKDLRQ